MQRGRPPEPILDDQNIGPITQTAAQIDERGRIQIPVKIAGLVDWLAPRKACDALAVLEELGLIRLYPWDKFGERVIQTRSQLIERAVTDPTALEPLRALEDRYKRVRIPVDLRLTLSSEMISHLGLTLSVPSLIYVWRVTQFLELISMPHRIKNLTIDLADLDDLP